ncbi:MAG: hypothetical protein HY393_02765 [Candidatus Diapherotrites archaeon]|nr:hypothetical protein [Candidatus Diapherotrites archaeon]
MQSPLDQAMNSAKKNCKLCHARRTLRATDAERALAREGVQDLISYFAQHYQDLRDENASGTEIQQALQNKRACMDLLSTCDSCDKQVDQVNRALLKLKA